MTSRCDCKSSCSVKRRENGTPGCPCKGNNVECSEDCKCGTRNKPCKNRAMPEILERERDIERINATGKATRAKGAKQSRSKGFNLSHKPAESEEVQREKEHKDVKDFIGTLDNGLVRKLAIRSLRRGIGSMDYIDSLLIMEDDLDESENVGEFGHTSMEQSLTDSGATTQASSNPQNPDLEEEPTMDGVADWVTPPH
ncbi:Hypothetical predicted protein [Paramuricea clavata]|uniref:Uncharacterized protein n=1 Tax=Paramuricea clavata TaxID=317549 RepID=A0A6S7G3Z3_PARCT|nr:Hypothetical predicted protein [Paramuricea clavata]